MLWLNVFIFTVARNKQIAVSDSWSGHGFSAKMFSSDGKPIFKWEAFANRLESNWIFVWRIQSEFLCGVSISTVSDSNEHNTWATTSLARSARRTTMNVKTDTQKHSSYSLVSKSEILSHVSGYVFFFFVVSRANFFFQLVGWLGAAEDFFFWFGWLMGKNSSRNLLLDCWAVNFQVNLVTFSTVLEASFFFVHPKCPKPMSP